jgi:hypothetical protein
MNADKSQKTDKCHCRKAGLAGIVSCRGPIARWRPKTAACEGSPANRFRSMQENPRLFGIVLGIEAEHGRFPRLKSQETRAARACFRHFSRVITEMHVVLVV